VDDLNLDHDMKPAADEPDPGRDTRERQREEVRKADRIAARRRAKVGAIARADVTSPNAAADAPPLAAESGTPSDEHRLEASIQNLDHRRLRRAWVVPVAQPMALISQVPRSGGTLLARLFDGHPACFTHPLELRWGRPSKENWPSFDADPATSADEAYQRLTEGWATRFVAQGGYSKYPKFRRMQDAADLGLSPFVYDQDLAFAIFAEAYPRAAARSRRAVLDAYLTSIFNGWLDYQNLYAAPKQWVVCFLPTIVTVRDSVERFFVDYPDGRLITMVRHPGSWFASFAAFSEHKGHVDLSGSMSLWLESAHASLAAIERYGERVILVLFEDLVLRTEATMRAVCARMNLAFDPVLVRPTYNGMPILSDSSFHMSASIDPETTARHLTKLSDEHRVEIDRIAMPLYHELARRHGLGTTV
jgi:hypothetical protein